MALCAGVDVGGTKIQVAVLRARRVLGQARVETPRGGPESVVSTIQAALDTASGAAGTTPDQLAAVGIGFPGVFDAGSGDVLRAVNLAGFDSRFPLGSRVSAAVGGVPVVLANDVAAGILGEFRAGAGRPYRNLLGVWVGTGVGGGLILGGKPWHGRGSAGEVGHMVVKPGGRACGCGRRGCLEAYAGRGRIQLTAEQLVKKGQKTVLFDLMKDKGRDRVTSGVVAAALKAGDSLTSKLIEEAVWALGAALASVQNLLDLEAMIVGGGLGDRLGQPFVDRVAAAMKPHLFRDDVPPKLHPTELGDLAGAVGAALLAGDSLRGRAASPAR